MFLSNYMIKLTLKIFIMIFLMGAENVMYKKAIKIWREKNTEDLLKKVLVKFIYCSNKLEVDETRLRDVEAIFNGEIVTGFNRNEKTIKEIECQRELCINIFRLSEEVVKTKLSMEVIEQVYFAITGNNVERDLYGSIDKLIQEINSMEIDDENALEVVSYFYCYFQTVSNYDGRVGRMLINYFLVANNLPPITIFCVDKEEYYKALSYFNKRQDISIMIEFLDSQAFKTWLKDYNLKIRSLKDFLDD